MFAASVGEAGGIRTNASRCPSGAQRGDTSCVPPVRRRGGWLPSAGTANSDVSYRFSFSLTTMRTKATVEPSGDIRGSATHVNLNRSVSAIGRRAPLD